MSRFFLLISLLFSLITAARTPSAESVIPVTGGQERTTVHAENMAPLPSLREFIPTIQNGNARQLVGVFVDDTLALRVVQQPSSNPGFVSTDLDVVTEFSIAKQYGTTGLLAHNTAAGEYFDDISAGEKIILVYGNGDLKYFMVDQIRQFQALSPNSPYSSFTDLAAPGKTLSVENLFYQIYRSKGNLVFQTCIARDGEPSWGRLFVIAHAIPAPSQLRNYSVVHLTGYSSQTFNIY